MRILLDVMGGDLPPAELIKGGVRAARKKAIEVILAGDPQTIQAALADAKEPEGRRCHILPSSSVVTMDDAPVRAVREKKDSSLVLGLEAIRDAEADAFVSPGNTGAIVASSIFTLGRVGGIPRPGILVSIPTVAGMDAYVIDVGANSDCTPEQLQFFALMGATYARDVAGISQPKLGLLNIGTEKTKGNSLIAKTHEQLDKSPLPFVGNVEANSVLSTRPVDVVVCDGFVGNVFLKSIEGGVYAVAQLLRKTIRGKLIAMLGALLMSGSIARVRGTLSYRRRGGAVLLGVNGVVVIAHGRSDAVAIESAIDVAAKQVQANLGTRFSEGIAGWSQHG